MKRINAKQSKSTETYINFVAIWAMKIKQLYNIDLYETARKMSDGFLNIGCLSYTWSSCGGLNYTCLESQPEIFDEKDVYISISSGKRNHHDTIDVVYSDPDKTFICGFVVTSSTVDEARLKKTLDEYIPKIKKRKDYKELAIFHVLQ
jgi:hypothetical protein